MNRRQFLAATAAPLFAKSTQTAFRLETGCPVADPACVHTSEGYYLTGTQHPRRLADRRFSLFFSTDLHTWRDLGPMLIRPDYEGSAKANYWAPEFIQLGDTWHLYYTADSFGDAERRYVRVATSAHLTGLYTDSGAKLVQQPSIDGHPHFLSPTDGWLFYTGNEGNPHVGQLLMDRFLTPTRLENKPRKVFPSETVEWEEGPYIIHHRGTYYLFSSMGNWRDGTYHVRIARARSLAGPWQRLMQNGTTYKLLQSTAEQSGPGHNSVFRGPGNDWWICYHAWDPKKTGRYPWVAPLTWDTNGYPHARQE